MITVPGSSFLVGVRQKAVVYLHSKTFTKHLRSFSLGQSNGAVPAATGLWECLLFWNAGLAFAALRNSADYSKALANAYTSAFCRISKRDDDPG